MLVERNVCVPQCCCKANLTEPNHLFDCILGSPHCTCHRLHNCLTLHKFRSLGGHKNQRLSLIPTSPHAHCSHCRPTPFQFLIALLANRRFRFALVNPKHWFWLWFCRCKLERPLNFLLLGLYGYVLCFVLDAFYSTVGHRHVTS